jgi:YHS domain-containing protein
MIYRFIFAAILLYLLYRIGRRLFLPAGKKVKPLPGEQDRKKQGEELVEDPVCHTYIPVSEAHTLTADGRALYFCSQKCLEQFKDQVKTKQEES